MLPEIRRVVTGHDENGYAVIASDGPLERVENLGRHGPILHEIWSTAESPALIDRDSVREKEGPLLLAPPKNGTRIRIVDIFPDAEDLGELDADDAKAHFEKIGAADASARAKGDAPHPFMHRTESIDYGIVLEGEVVLVVDKGETTLRKGDIAIQRGTNHAWSNRSDKICRIAFVLIDGKFALGD